MTISERRLTKREHGRRGFVPLKWGQLGPSKSCFVEESKSHTAAGDANR